MSPFNFHPPKIVNLTRALELSNDVEKNPGPPKVAKNNMMPPFVDTVEKGFRRNENGLSQQVEDGLFPDTSMELNDLCQVIARQADVICSQREEIEHLRRQIETNLKLTRDFQSEVSELRKCWQVMNDGKKLEDNPTGMASKLESLSSAYNDIQDRLHELDKSWKNNLMIYGVPSEENVDEDPIITEEKVLLFLFYLGNCCPYCNKY